MYITENKNTNLMYYMSCHIAVFTINYTIIYSFYLQKPYILNFFLSFTKMQCNAHHFHFVPLYIYCKVLTVEHLTGFYCIVYYCKNDIHSTV